MPKIPIFIIGINPRSGTNYLHQLIELHPDCDYSKHYGEDFLLFHAEKYLDYYKSVCNQWKPEWNNDIFVFKNALESGLINYLDSGKSTTKYIVTKTPHPENANLFLDVFSTGYMILIVRQGQDLVESFMRTFDRSFNHSLRGWVKGAECILEVVNDPKIMNSGRVICIKYEDLYTKNQEVMSKLLDFLQMDKSKFDFKTSQDLPVIGSSTFKGNAEKVTWEPIPKTDSFKPLGRFNNWSKFRHYRFNWIAGKYSKQLGYELYHETPNPVYFLMNSIIMFGDFFHRIYSKIKLEINGSLKRKSRR